MIDSPTPIEKIRFEPRLPRASVGSMKRKAAAGRSARDVSGWLMARPSTLVSASLAYSTVIFASLFGVLLWDEVLPLTAWLAIGLIVASGLLASAQSRAPAGQD